MSRYRYWEGEDVTEDMNFGDVLVFGSNPQGRHGKGLAAVAAGRFGAVMGRGRGIAGRSYALVTKNLSAGYVEKLTGIRYRAYGGISPRYIIANIRELYETAKKYPNKLFFVPYRLGGENLNGYSSANLLNYFKHGGVPPINIVFHQTFALDLCRDSYRMAISTKS